MDMIDIKNESGFQEQISESECPSSFESTMNVSANDGMPDFKSKIISGQIQLREKRGRSRAWNIFATMIDENGDEIENFVACRNCFSSYKFVNSTSNLVKHKCFLQYEAKENQRNPQYVPLSFEIKDKLSDAVVQWLVKNGRSCNILQDSGLKDFVRILLTIGADFGENVNMEDVIPNPATIAVTIKELYEERRQAIIAELGNAKNGYSITTAIWVDNCLKQPLASVTVHYIQQSAMVSRLLAVYPLARDANTVEE
ncbi:hypothetical protein AWZ03_001313 [Drosophila navojoa]|uniref:Hermes trasposase DNA-binding domain-containing protein n=1 Tax=Drosophila navojoa TaxID=7232 RepID=A0A484BUX7_DRONA|nr:hypothetical protein AWZ03_001313 [Drosophila navojoa]